MRKLTLLVLIHLAVGSLLSADVALTDGRVLREFKIVQQTGKTVIVRHQDGLTSVGKDLLPPELQREFPVYQEPEPPFVPQQATKPLVKMKSEKDSNSQDAQLVFAQLTPDDPAQAETVRDIAQKVLTNYFSNTLGGGMVHNVTTNLTLEEPEVVPGWNGRWRIRGFVWVDSTYQIERSKWKPRRELTREEREKMTAREIRRYEDPPTFSERRYQNFEAEFYPFESDPRISVSSR